jgi:diguanylate cyclase (GGDEF)-like protein
MRELSRKLARRPGSLLTVLGVFLAASIVLLFLVDLQYRYRSALVDAKKTALNLAEILSEHAAMTFESIDSVLREAEAIRRDTSSGSSSTVDTANAALRQLQKSSSVLVAVAWTNAAGDLMAHSYDHPPPRNNIADMPHFIAQRDGGGDGLAIAPPFRSVASDKWITAATRRLSNADGSFAGVVSAALDQSYFTKLYRTIDLGKGGSVLLVHSAGRILAREPMIEGTVGKSFSDAPLLTEYLPKSTSGAFERISVIDKVARIVGYKAVPGLPIVAVVSLARADVLEPWYQHLWTFGPMVSLTVIAILFGTARLVRQANNLAAQTKALVQSNARFDAAVSNMSQGLCLFDVDKKLVISNKTFRDIFDLPDELAVPGTPLKRILQHYAGRGETSDLSVDEHVRTMPTETRQVFTLANGRVISIRRTPMLDGGWVATHDDVTEQKRSERLLAEKATDLERMIVRFDAAINNMSQGLCLFDAEQNVVVSNRRYSEIYHLSREQTRPGTPLPQILESRRQQGTHFGPAPDVYVNATVKEASEVRELADGRVVTISRHVMPDGGWLTTHEDITDRARNEKRIAFLAQHDLLTGLANRVLFAEKLDEVAKRCQRQGVSFTVLMLDLDKFKNVNDTLGHPAGDQLLVEVARRLQSSLRDTDVLARLGGDEFAIIQENEKIQSEGAIALALRIIALVAEPFDLNGRQASVGASIGIVFAPEHGVGCEELLKKADIALYAAKAGGRNDFRIFQSALTEAADSQRSMEAELRRAISRNEFELHYQPIVDVNTRQLCGVEALVRWRHPSKGLIGPDRFIPLAETTGLLLPLGEWILQQACADAAAWPPHIKIAINISAVQFKKETLFDVILCALVESGLSPERLELEITEASLLDNQAAHLLTIRQLKNVGVSIALDDFGTGHSSPSYLTDFPFDKIKIDKSFTQGMPGRADCAAVVASVVALAHGLDMAITAEGVETEKQLDALRAAGIDLAQGYLFGRPVPLAEFDFDGAACSVQHVA